MFYNLIKNSFFLQNLFLNFSSMLHPSIMHNLGKIEMLKKALFYCDIENIEGNYFEFGIYEGTSLLAAVKIHKKIKSKIPRNFYGFDSFDQGFKYFDEKDKHPFFKEDSFISSYKRVQKRFKKHKNVKLIKGYFEDTLDTIEVLELKRDNKCAIIFIDCDLKNPARVALDYISPILQAGTIIILDDYLAYKGNINLGVAGAFSEFLKKKPNIETRSFIDYGYGGTSFIVTKV